MNTDRLSVAVSNWRQDTGAQSLISTPRNARVLLAYQQITEEKDGPVTDAFVTAQFGEGLPYLYEVRAEGEPREYRFRIAEIEANLAKFLGARPGEWIDSTLLGGVEQAFSESLRAAGTALTPMIVRISLGLGSGALRHFENLVLPFSSSSDPGELILIGALDEVGVVGPHSRELQWANVAAARASPIGVARPIRN